MRGRIQEFVTANIDRLPRLIGRYPLATFGAFLVAAIVSACLLAPLLATHDPNAPNLDARLLAPSLEHWLGTDQFGRDVYSRLLYGGRVSLAVGFVAVGVYVSIGVIVGLVSGYFGGWVDFLLMRIVDVLLCIPTFFLILMVITFVGPSLVNVMLVIGLTSWTDVARLVRGEVLSVKGREFVLASVGIGATTPRILFRHILPNVLGPVLVVATLGVAGAVLVESGLSFLGLGVQPPAASWGNMLLEGKHHLVDAWWLVIFPGLAIFLTVFGYNLLGEGLRDFLDPRMQDAGDHEKNV